MIVGEERYVLAKLYRILNMNEDNGGNVEIFNLRTPLSGHETRDVTRHDASRNAKLRRDPEELGVGAASSVHYIVI